MSNQRRKEVLKCPLVNLVRECVFERMIALADNRSVNAEIRAAAMSQVVKFATQEPLAESSLDASLINYLRLRAISVINRTFEAPANPSKLDTPPGSPIGSK